MLTHFDRESLKTANLEQSFLSAEQVYPRHHFFLFCQNIPFHVHLEGSAVLTVFFFPQR